MVHVSKSQAAFSMVLVILWSSLGGVPLAVGALLMWFSMLATVGLGVAMVVFSIGTGLYACWVTRRVGFTARVFERAVKPVDKFRGLNGHGGHHRGVLQVGMVSTPPKRRVRRLGLP